MESTTITPAPERAVDAPTVTEALRRTAASHPDLVAVRTADDEISLTWSQLLGRVDALAGGLAGLGVGRGDTVAIMLGNRPEFYVADLAAVTVGATPFSIYVTYPPAEIEFLCADAGARVAITEQTYLAAVLAARQHLPSLEHVIVIDGEAPEGTLALSEVEGSNPGFDAAASDRPNRPRGHRHADLHVGHHGPSQGRPADPPRDHVLGSGSRGDGPPVAGEQGDLVAAGGPHRRTHGPPLHPGDLRRHCHHLPGPARDPLLPAAGAPDLVLRGPADLGEAQGGTGDDAGRAAR